MQQHTHINGAPVEPGAADAERDIRGFAVKSCTDEGKGIGWATTRRCSFCATRCASPT